MKLYGLTEIAAAVGAQPRTLAVRFHRGKLPEPTARLACGPVWVAKDIEPYIKAATIGSEQTV